VYEEDETPTANQPDPDRLVLQQLDLPSGEGWVRWGDPHRLRGREVSQIREAAGSVKNVGLAGQAVMHKAICLLVTEWQVDYIKPDPQLPRYAPKVLGQLYSEDLVAMERHILPVLDMYNPEKESPVP
jgi:hypothetical protein